jgi:hypothetical protein
LASQEGQTAAEYLGVLLVVAAIIAAIAQLGLPERLGQEVARAVCMMASDDPEENCPPSAGSRAEHEEPGPEGPAAGGAAPRLSLDEVSAMAGRAAPAVRTSSAGQPRNLFAVDSATPADVSPTTRAEHHAAVRAARTVAGNVLREYCKAPDMTTGTTLCSGDQYRENEGEIIATLLEGESLADIELEREEFNTEPPWYDPFNLVSGGAAAATAKVGVSAVRRAAGGLLGSGAPAAASGAAASFSQRTFTRMPPTLKLGMASLATRVPSRTATSGIYVIRTPSGAYVGQSGNISARLARHVRDRRFTRTEVAAAQRYSVPGGKTAREMAEQVKINSREFRGLQGGRLRNKVNPIGPDRRALFPRSYRYPGER